MEQRKGDSPVTHSVTHSLGGLYSSHFSAPGRALGLRNLRGLAHLGALF